MTNCFICGIDKGVMRYYFLYVCPLCKKRLQLRDKLRQEEEARVRD